MTPLIFGEILFDEFPGGIKVLGGAPFNVCWNLRAFQLDPLLISRIGNDDAGKKIHHTLETRKIQTRGIQIDPDHITGHVIITLTDSSHQFEIPTNQAFDFIDSKKLPDVTENTNLLYFGSLSLRNKTSREALETLLSLPLKHFVDINLRAPWWDEHILALALTQAHWLKVNDEELNILHPGHEADAIESNIKSFYERYPFHTIIVTCGENGAFFYDGNRLLHDKSPTIHQMKDTVGAGDAFSAVVIYGIHQNWPMKKILKRALAFAANICRIQGATTNDMSFYRQQTQYWID